MLLLILSLLAGAIWLLIWYINRPPLSAPKKGFTLSTEEEKGKKSDFVIEYYPLVGKYYPKYKNRYLYKDPLTKIFDIRGRDYMAYSQSSSTEAGADAIIAEFKEQQLKENVKIIQR